MSNGKNVVFVHGYNVSEQSARGWNAEIFKRLHQSGSKARFYAVDWDGNESQVTVLGHTITPNYHTNAANAFLTAPALQGLLYYIQGDTTLIGHSLGNMVCLSAISDYGAAPARYFMVDAAVPMEAIDSSLDTVPSMVHPDWTSVSNCFWASKWFNVWPSSDSRNSLTWNGRLSNLGNVAVYNFFSSGEEVLREDTNAPPSGIVAALYDNAMNYFADQAGVYAWVWQEKTKGRMSYDGILGSTHGGWGFNDDTDSGYVYFVNGIRTHIPPTVLTNSVIQTNAFFDMTVDAAMFKADSSGSTYAQNNRNRILGDAIPALTLPIGANYVTNLDIQAAQKVNFNMQDFENGWPFERLISQEQNNWHHSDIRDVAYPYNYKFFNQVINLGNLK